MLPHRCVLLGRLDYAAVEGVQAGAAAAALRDAQEEARGAAEAARAARARAQAAAAAEEGAKGAVRRLEAAAAARAEAASRVRAEQAQLAAAAVHLRRELERLGSEEGGQSGEERPGPWKGRGGRPVEDPAAAAAAAAAAQAGRRAVAVLGWAASWVVSCAAAPAGWPGTLERAIKGS
jgi:hypothetical protein